MTRTNNTQNSNNQENQKTEEMMTQKSQKQQVTEPIAKKEMWQIGKSANRQIN